MKESEPNEGGEEASVGGQREGASQDGHAEQGLRPPADGAARSGAGAAALQVRDAADGAELHHRALRTALVMTDGNLSGLQRVIK